VDGTMYSYKKQRKKTNKSKTKSNNKKK